MCYRQACLCVIALRFKNLFRPLLFKAFDIFHEIFVFRPSANPLLERVTYFPMDIPEGFLLNDINL
jgi:hypothetical protein